MLHKCWINVGPVNVGSMLDSNVAPLRIKWLRNSDKVQAGISVFFKEYIGWKMFRAFLRVIWGLVHVFGGYFRGWTSFESEEYPDLKWWDPLAWWDVTGYNCTGRILANVEQMLNQCWTNIGPMFNKCWTTSGLTNDWTVSSTTFRYSCKDAPIRNIDREPTVEICNKLKVRQLFPE